MKTKNIAFALITVAAAFACGPDTPSSVPTPPPTPPAVPPPPGPPPPPPPPGQPPPPPPGGSSGRLTVSLTTPNSDDAAILLELRGATIHGITLANSSWKMFADSSGTPIRIMLAGNLTSGSLLSFEVPDVTGTYTATIVDVADKQNQIRTTSGYTLKVAP